MPGAIYADHASTCPVSRKVAEVVAAVMAENWGNPSGLHGKSRRARELVEKSRARVAAALGAYPDEIFFTSGGTEADNWAIKGAAGAMALSGRRRIVTDSSEHPAVLASCAALEHSDFSVSYIGVDRHCVVNTEELFDSITEDTGLVSVMYVNNETGSINPIREIAAAAHRSGSLMFTDAVQALGSLPLSVSELGVDLLSVSGHKIFAPKGIGALYVRRGTPIIQLIDGGGQEHGMRSGTENTAFIAGFAQAVEDAVSGIGRTSGLMELRRRLETGLLEIPGTTLNGHPEDRAPGIVNISFRGVSGESLVSWLDMNGIYASAGAACSSGNGAPSHVLLACGLSPELASSAVRFSISFENTAEEIERIIETTARIVGNIRRLNSINL